jgi:predicted RNase H-like HicB family nuclease
MPEDYQYTVKWSEQDQLYIGRVAEFPLLAARGDSEAKALEEIKAILAAVLEDLTKEGASITEPYSPLCRLCNNQRLDLNSRKPWRWWCAMCRKWFDKDLNRINPEYSEISGRLPFLISDSFRPANIA